MTYTFTNLSAWGDYFYPTGINNQGVITGVNPDANGFGVVLNGAALTTTPYQPNSIVVPNDPLALRNSTYAMGINDAGTIVGNYYGHDGHTHGFIYQNGKFTTVDAPGAVYTSLNAINNNGEIVGGYLTPSEYPGELANAHGLIYDKGTLTTLDNGANSDTYLTGINDAGLIVGHYGYGEPAGLVASLNGALPLAPLAYTPDMASLTVWDEMADFGYPPPIIPYSELQSLISFNNAQHAFAQLIGVDPELYVYEALGAALSSQTNFLQLANIPNDAAFVHAAYQQVFGQVGSAAQQQSFLGQLHFLEALYSIAHVPNYELVAKGGTVGLMVGVEAEMTIVPIIGTTSIVGTTLHVV